MVRQVFAEITCFFTKVWVYQQFINTFHNWQLSLELNKKLCVKSMQTNIIIACLEFACQPIHAQVITPADIIKVKS